MTLVIAISPTIESNSKKKQIIGSEPNDIQNTILAINKDNANNTSNIFFKISITARVD